MTESDLGDREAARERQSYVRHELRAPLAVMYPSLSLLLDGGAGELTPKQREYLEILAVRRLGGQEGTAGRHTLSGLHDIDSGP